MYSAGKPPNSRAATSTVQQLLLFSPSVCVCACVSHEHHLPLHHSEPRRLVKALGGELGRGCEVGRSSCSPCLQVVLFCPLSAHGSPERRLMTCSPSGDKQDRCACNDKASVTEEWQTCYVHSMSELNAAGFISTFTCVMCCYGNLWTPLCIPYETM